MDPLRRAEIFSLMIKHGATLDSSDVQPGLIGAGAGAGLGVLGGLGLASGMKHPVELALASNLRNSQAIGMLPVLSVEDVRAQTLALQALQNQRKTLQAVSLPRRGSIKRMKHILKSSPRGWALALGLLGLGGAVTGGVVGIGGSRAFRGNPELEPFDTKIATAGPLQARAVGLMHSLVNVPKVRTRDDLKVAADLFRGLPPAGQQVPLRRALARLGVSQ